MFLEHRYMALKLVPYENSHSASLLFLNFSLDLGWVLTRLGAVFSYPVMHPLKVSLDRERLPSDRYRCGPGLHLQCSMMLLKEVLLGVWQCNVKSQSKGRKKQPSLYNKNLPCPLPLTNENLEMNCK